MRGLYYKIWADAIKRYWKNHPKQPWKLNVFIIMTWVHALNAFILILWLVFFKILPVPVLELDFFPGNLIDAFLSFAVTFLPPFILVNYFLVFYKNRYKKIVIRYKDFKYNLAMIYSLSIVIGAFVSAVLYGLLK